MLIDFNTIIVLILTTENMHSSQAHMGLNILQARLQISLNKFKNIKIIQSFLHDHNGMELFKTQ